MILVGANGAGKSTLLRVLTGVIYLGMEHDEFDINGNDKPQDQFNGVAYLGGAWKRRRTASTASDPYSMDIAARDMMKAWQDANPERRDELVRVLGMNLDWRMHECSDGQRKKVRIMLKLLRPFRLCVIDEFAADLDIFSRKRFFDYLTAECAKRAASVVYATHIFDQADVWATHVAFMQLDKVLSPVHRLATYAPYQAILARTGAARSFCPMYDLVLEELERQYRAHSDCFTDDNQCLTDVIVAKECGEREDNAHEFALGTRDNSGYADGRLARELAIESMKEESKLSMTAKLKAQRGGARIDEFRATYDASKKRLGDEHPDTLASAKMLGVVLHDKARILDEEGGSDPATPRGSTPSRPTCSSRSSASTPDRAVPKARGGCSRPTASAGRSLRTRGCRPPHEPCAFRDSVALVMRSTAARRSAGILIACARLGREGRPPPPPSLLPFHHHPIRRERRARGRGAGFQNERGERGAGSLLDDRLRQRVCTPARRRPAATAGPSSRGANRRTTSIRPRRPRRARARACASP